MTHKKTMSGIAPSISKVKANYKVANVNISPRDLLLWNVYV